MRSPPPRRPPRPRAPMPSSTRQIMQTVLDNMNEGVQLFDKDFNVEFVNRQLIDFHGPSV